MDGGRGDGDRCRAGRPSQLRVARALDVERPDRHGRFANAESARAVSSGQWRDVARLQRPVRLGTGGPLRIHPCCRQHRRPRLHRRAELLRAGSMGLRRGADGLVSGRRSSTRVRLRAWARNDCGMGPIRRPNGTSSRFSPRLAPLRARSACRRDDRDSRGNGPALAGGGCRARRDSGRAARSAPVARYAASREGRRRRTSPVARRLPAAGVPADRAPRAGRGDLRHGARGGVLPAFAGRGRQPEHRDANRRRRRRQPRLPVAAELVLAVRSDACGRRGECGNPEPQPQGADAAAAGRDADCQSCGARFDRGRARGPSRVRPGAGGRCTTTQSP